MTSDSITQEKISNYIDGQIFEVKLIESDEGTRDFLYDVSTSRGSARVAKLKPKDVVVLTASMTVEDSLREFDALHEETKDEIDRRIRRLLRTFEGTFRYVNPQGEIAEFDELHRLSIERVLYPEIDRQELNHSLLSVIRHIDAVGALVESYLSVGEERGFGAGEI
ncbi:MAG: hypothetical protein SV253_00200 [Halobacteria archaeon]|nr:hypothetical protein [Halobacteria archaeon]